MENIGLYLNPKPSLLHNSRTSTITVAGFTSPKGQLIQSNEKLTSPSDHQSGAGNTPCHGSSSHWEDELVLEWPYNETIHPSNVQQQQEKAEGVISQEVRTMPRVQPSLLSYLPSKNKTTCSSSSAGTQILNATFKGDERTTAASSFRTEIEIENEFTRVTKHGEPSFPNQASKAITNAKVFITNIPTDSTEKQNDYNQGLRNSSSVNESDVLTIPSQTDFLRQMNLITAGVKMPLTDNSECLASQITPSKLKLWHPERESSNIGAQNPTNDEIWIDVLDSAAAAAGNVYCQ